MGMTKTKKKEIRKIKLKSGGIIYIGGKNKLKGFSNTFEESNSIIEEIVKAFSIHYTAEWRWVRERINKPSAEDFLRTSLEKALQTQKTERDKVCEKAVDAVREVLTEMFERKEKRARAELVKKVERMKNHNEMLEMEGREYTRGFEKALFDLLKEINN